MPKRMVDHHNNKKVSITREDISKRKKALLKGMTRKDVNNKRLIYTGLPNAKILTSKSKCRKKVKPGLCALCRNAMQQ